MKHYYTPSQLAAIEASEAAIDLEDLATQGIIRQDPWSLQYLDDLREIDRLIDKKPKAEITDSGNAPKLDIENGLDYVEGGKVKEAIGRGMKEIESRIFDSRSFEELFQQIRESRLPQSMKDKILGMRAFVGTEKEHALRLRLISLTKILGKEDPVVVSGRKLSQAKDEMSMERYNDEILNRLGPRDYDSVSDIVGGDRLDLVRPDYSELAPPIPKFEDPRIRWPTGDEDDPTTAGLLRLSLQTGYSQEELKKFRVKRLVQHRVVNQTRMGKIQSIYCLSIAGNGNGLLGIGEGKSAEPEDSRRQAMLNALRNMKPIHRYEARTIYGEVHGKVGATEVQLMARPPGMFSSIRLELILSNHSGLQGSAFVACILFSRSAVFVVSMIWQLVLLVQGIQ
jgi:small subunit ribosomal protein S5